jgi:hypothetical protein
MADVREFPDNFIYLLISTEAVPLLLLQCKIYRFPHRINTDLNFTASSTQ